MYIDCVVKLLHAQLEALRRLARYPCNIDGLVVQSIVHELLLNLWLQVSLLGNHQHRNVTAGGAWGQPAADGLAQRLPALRPEDVLIQRDARGQKVLLGKGAFGKVGRPHLTGEHAALHLGGHAGHQHLVL